MIAVDDDDVLVASVGSVEGLGVRRWDEVIVLSSYEEARYEAAAASEAEREASRKVRR